MNLKQWTPDIITLFLAGLLAALLVITQQVWAGPLVGRLTSTTTASSRTTINYQGYLTDAGGTPVNDTLDMVFRLYGVEAGGEALWAESHNGVPVAGGLFSVLLGGSRSDPSPIPPSLFAENDSLWLGISVGGDEEMVPREQLASAPSAMTVPDGSVTTAKLADGAVTSSKLGIGIYPFSRREDQVIRYRGPTGQETTLDISTCSSGGWCCNSSDTICYSSQSGQDSVLAFRIEGANSIACTLLHDEDDWPSKSKGIYFATDGGNQSPMGTWTALFSRDGTAGIPIRENTIYRWICF